MAAAARQGRNGGGHKLRWKTETTCDSPTRDNPLTIRYFLYKMSIYTDKGLNMTDALRLSKFMYETIAGGHTNQLPISSVCNAQCIFCSNNLNPFPIYREGFRPLEDIKKGIALLSDSSEIRLGDSLPGRISEGEALLHPELFTVLKLIRDRFPSTPIQISTNGIRLTKDFIEKLVPFQPLKFTISYHSDNPEYWSRIFSQHVDNYKIARNSFFYLQKHNFDTHKFAIEGALVPMPKMVGYDDIENTIKYLRTFTRTIIAYLPGYSFKARPATKNILDINFSQTSSFMTEMRKKYRADISVFPDLLKPLSFNPTPVMKETFSSGFKNVLWISSEAAYAKLKKLIGDYAPFVPNDHYIFMAKNSTYRGNIICSGLLMVDDYRTTVAKALHELGKRGIKADLIILPKMSFDRYGDDLKCDNFEKLREEFNIPVWLKN